MRLRNQERAVWVGGDAGNIDSARSQMDREEHVIREQPAQSPHFHREEIGGGQQLPVGSQECTPGRMLAPLGRRLNPMAFEHVGYGGGGNDVSQVG